MVLGHNGGSGCCGAVIRAIPEGEWKEPEKGCGYKVAETVHTQNRTKKAFRLIIKRALRHRPDLFEEEGWKRALSCPHD
ncbi:MAG: hypothetical protein HY037_07520 [Nitrospirae bacterium]|nr:hypothetical protein [Candidatus Troglogloeales bacterium]